MLVFRHLMAVSTGAVIALSYGAAATAQSLNSIDKPKDNTQTQPSVVSEIQTIGEKNPTRLVNDEPSVVDVAQMSEEKQGAENEQVPESMPTQQTQPTPSTSKTTAPEYLNPNANPLLFPTKPEEVELTRVEEITLEQAIELALRNNKELQSQRLELEGRQIDLSEAEAGRLPEIDFNLTYSFGDSSGTELLNLQRNNELVNPFFSNTIDEQFSGNVQLEYFIYEGGRVSANIRQNERELRRQQLQVEVTRQQTRFEATRDYYNLQDADAQVVIQQAAVEDAQQSLRDARLLEQAGLGTRFSVLQSEVDLASVEQNLTDAIAQQRTAQRQLAETLSVGQQIQLRSADEIKEAGDWNLSLKESIVLAFQNRGELEQRLLDREINEQQREIELAAVRPSISIFTTYDFVDDFRDRVGVADGYSVGARLRWRLLSRQGARSRAERAEKNIEIAETNFANDRNQIRLQVESAFFDLVSNKENIATSSKNVERAEERLRLARLRFQAGVGTQTEVIDAQRDLADARGNFLRAIIGYNQALNELQRAVSNLPNSRIFQVP
ncbi:MAG: TolC family protein [Prochloraceae cyanobacterium]